MCNSRGTFLKSTVLASLLHVLVCLICFNTLGWEGFGFSCDTKGEVLFSKLQFGKTAFASLCRMLHLAFSIRKSWDKMVWGFGTLGALSSIAAFTNCKCCLNNRHYVGWALSYFFNRENWCVHWLINALNIVAGEASESRVSCRVGIASRCYCGALPNEQHYCGGVCTLQLWTASTVRKCVSKRHRTNKYCMPGAYVGISVVAVLVQLSDMCKGPNPSMCHCNALRDGPQSYTHQMCCCVQILTAQTLRICVSARAGMW